MLLLIKFLLLLAAVFTGYSLGYFFTEKYIIAQRIPLFDFEAFRCRKCLSTHIAWVTSTCISLLFGDWLMLLVGLIFAGALFVGLKIDEKKKTVTIKEFEKIYIK